MKDILEYKGYHTRIVFCAESCTLRGIIEGINDYIDFESDSIQEIEQEFHSAVDEYLAFCEEVHKNPEKEYKGSFNIRISPELHKKIAQKAYNDNVSLNAEVEKAIASFVSIDAIQSLSVSTYEKEYQKESHKNFRDYLSGSAIGSDDKFNILSFPIKAAQ